MISQPYPGLGRSIAPRFGIQHFSGGFIMAIAEQAASRSHLASHSYDRWILVGYLAFAILAIAAIYFASGQPGFTKADPLGAIALP